MLVLRFIINLLIRKDVNELATVYATLIVKGNKVFSDVPDKIKDQVKDILLALDCGDLAAE